MILNYLTRLYCGMVYRLTPSGGQTTKTGPSPGPGEPEEEIKELLDSIRQRVYTLKTVVEEQSREIEQDLDASMDSASRLFNVDDIEQNAVQKEQNEDNL